MDSSNDQNRGLRTTNSGACVTGEVRSMKYILHGDPVPLARIRYGHRRLYDAQRPIKDICRNELKKQHTGELFSGPISVEFIFHFKMPTSKISRWDWLRGTYHYFKPDLSNLIKFVEDIGNRIIYGDDCSICKINAKKVYGDTPMTEMIVTQVKVYDAKEER